MKKLNEWKSVGFLSKSLYSNWLQSRINLLYTCLGMTSIAILIITSSCSTPNPTAVNYLQINLVADTIKLGATRIDPNLKNAWGMAISPSGAFWIASNYKGVITVYDRADNQLQDAVSIPFHGNHNGGSPTGMIYNNTTSFMGYTFLIATENGTIEGWKTGSSTETLIDHSTSHTVYKGIAIANNGGTNYLYVADFRNAKIDVFDQSFHDITTMPFKDPTIPTGYAPFNIKNVGSQLYVTYAKQKGPDYEDDESGVGNGFVSIFNYDGTFVRRFATKAILNSPWGIAVAPSGFGGGANDILIGNFGDGNINVFTATGQYKGPLMQNGANISIDGLWDITFPQNGVPIGNQNQLFFTAGPHDEKHGLFGLITKR